MNKTKLTLILSALLLLALAFTFSGQATAQSESSQKITAPPGIFDANQPGVSLLQDYGTFALYQVSDSALHGLSASQHQQVSTVDERILLDAYPFNPQTDRLDIPAELRLDEISGSGLQIVQFVGPIKDEWLKSLRAAGLTPIQYIANQAYLVWADDADRVQLDSMVIKNDYLEYSAPYQPYFKLGSLIREQVVDPSLADSAERIPVVVQIYNHPGNLSSKKVIQSLSVDQITDWSPILAYENAIFTLRIGDLVEISRLPDVVWLNQKLEPELTDEVQGQILAGNFDASQSGPSAPGYLTWLNSYGFSTNPADYPIVDVTDDGIGNGTVNSGDPTLHETGSLANPTRLAYVANCTDSADGSGVDGHGHINTSIVGSYDNTSSSPYVDPLGYQRGLGINPYGRLAGTRIFDPGFDQSSCGGTDTGVIKSVQDNGALINTNSWGCGACAGSYDDSSQAYDVGVRDADLTEAGNQELIIIFSAGNSGSSAGTIGTPGNGKNMITVGASENDRPTDEDGSWTDGCGVGPTGADNAMDVISFSSRGPAPGGRVKPELIAPGTHIQGTASTNAGYTGNSVCDQYRPLGQTTFAASSGTSHSTPAVAGVSSLAYWWLENTYSLTPSPAMMKAYLIAHPTYLTGASANDTLPSNSQGYGMPNMSLMFDATDKYLLDQSVVFDNTGEAWAATGSVVDNTKPVRIVLVYTDAPGALGTSPQVNNLNLSATINGSAYLGNFFSGQWSITGGTADTANNYEAIFLPAGTSGDIDITVIAFNIAGDGIPNVGDGTDQDFAIVCYNCSLTPVQPAVIEVDPMALETGLIPDAQITQTLTISNAGSSDLDWDIFEDGQTSVAIQHPVSSQRTATNLLQFAESNATRDPAQNDNAPTAPDALQTIIDQAPNQSNGVFSDSNCDLCSGSTQVIAENFTLSENATITSMVIWGGYYPLNVPASTDVFTVIIHQDSGGLPGTTISTENNVPYARVQTGVVLFGVNEWMHTLTLATPIDLTPGSYWIEIYNDTGVGTDDYFWEVANADTIGNGSLGFGLAFEAPGVTWFDDPNYDLAIQLIGDVVITCYAPTDIPWLSLSPTSGTVAPDLSAALDIVYDSTGLVTGEYTGTLCINSNDPVTPQVQVPVTLTVCTQPATITDVSISHSGNDVTLDWTAVPGATAYRIYRTSNNPYYIPGISFIYDLAPTNTYTDVGAAGDTNNNYYYIVQAVSTCGAGSVESTESNRTAEFDYPIQPGTP